LLNFVEHGFLKVEELFAVVEYVAVQAEVLQLFGQVVDFSICSFNLYLVHFVVPVKRSLGFVTLLELDELFLEVARLVHDGVANRLFQGVNVILNLDDLLAKVDPMQVSALYFFEVLVKCAFVF